MGAKSKIITTSKNSKTEAIFLIDHLRHLFSNPKDSELMRWWATDERKKDNGVLHHPFDTQQWKDFDTKYREFHEDLRNVRFTLSTNGMNPFGDKTSTHNTWPVILSIYNLPPWLCQKEEVFVADHYNFRAKSTKHRHRCFSRAIDARNGDTMEAWSENVG